MGVRLIQRDCAMLCLVFQQAVLVLFKKGENKIFNSDKTKTIENIFELEYFLFCAVLYNKILKTEKWEKALGMAG